MYKNISSIILDYLQDLENGATRLNEPFPADLKEILPLDLLPIAEEKYVGGSTYIPANNLYIKTIQEYKRFIDKKDFYRVLFALQKSHEIQISKLLDKTTVSRFNTYNAEKEVAESIKKRLKYKIKLPDDLDMLIDDLARKNKILLSAGQRNAVKTSLSYRLSIITGGAGVGKTAVQKIIISTYREIHPKAQIFLAAPSGMAAKKIITATGYPASTVHSLLRLKKTENGMYIKNRDISPSLLIIDEASMIDVALLRVIFQSVSCGTQIIFVGDVQQLPSIACGNCLKDMIESRLIPTSNLTTIFRQSDNSTLAINAARIKNGSHFLEKGTDFTFIEKETSEEIADCITSLFSEVVYKYGLENVEVLSPLKNKTKTGTNALNLQIKKIYNNDESIQIGDKQFSVGDKVMFTKNKHPLYNGDVGIIKNISVNAKKTIVQVQFPQKMVTVSDNDLHDLTLSYATTIHKAQGSEYSIVILVCDNAHSIMLERSLIYTAVTRAKKYLYVIGSMNAFKNAITTDMSPNRQTHLSLFLTR